MKRQPVLITGAKGFIGSHLLRQLARANIEAYGPDMQLHNYSSIDAVVSAKAWGTVVHLAALSHVPTCEIKMEDTFRTNLNGTALLLEVLKRKRPHIHFVFASTAQVYQLASSTDNIALVEDNAISPQNLYAQTKWQAELLIKDAARQWGLKSTLLRLFNHTHKSQSPLFFVPRLFSLLSCSRGQTTGVNIPVGNLDLYRDIGSLTDLLCAFQRVIEAGVFSDEANVFNICSGSLKYLKSIAEELALRLEVNARFQLDASKFRIGEPKRMLGSHLKFTQAYNWMPTCSTERQLISAFLIDLK